MFDPRDFFTYANRLASESEEVALRTAVGRAYYAVFLLARDKMRVQGKHNVHARVIAAAQRRGARAVATQLLTLKKLRTTADYELQPNADGGQDWLHNWRRARRIARDLLQEIDSWP